MESLNLPIQEIMSRPARTIAPEMTLGDLLRLFSSNGFAAYPVVRDEKLLGIVSRADAIQPFVGRVICSSLDFETISATTVEEIMSSAVIAIEPDATLRELINLMGSCDFDSFPVVDRESHVEGIVTRNDVILAMARSTWRSPLPLELRPVGYAIA